MRRFLSIFSGVAALFRRTRRDAEMSAEIQAHVDALTERNRAAGMAPDEARYAALREFGGVEQIKERCRDEHIRGFIWLEQTMQDFRHAIRALLRHRLFTAVAVVTLALGIGVNAALFTVFDVMTLRPLPVKDPHRLFDVRRSNDLGWSVPGFSYPEYLDLRTANHAFEGFAAWMDVVMTLDDRAEQPTSFILRQSAGASAVPVQFVSENYLPLLGGDVALGRGFLPEENMKPGAHPVIVLSHQFWVEEYDADPGVLGKTIKLNDTAYTIIGVTASNFSGKQLAPPIGWIPAMMLDDRDGGAKVLNERANTRFLVFTRLRPAFSRAEAFAELQLAVQHLAADTQGPRRLTHVRMFDAATFLPLPLNWKTAAILAPIWMSFLAVLLIAAANVTNLVLARATLRQHEIGVRLALGATRARLVRHMLMETAVIAVAGGAAGLMVTTWLLRFIRPHIVGLLPPDPRTRDWLFVNLTPDFKIMAATLALVLVAGLVAGVVPALLSAGADVNRSLKYGGAALTANSRPRRVLVIAQIAICLVLLAGAGVLVRHVVSYATIDTGLRTENVYPAKFRVLPSNFRTLTGDARTHALQASDTPMAQSQALELARSLPGITAIAQAGFVPFGQRLRYAAVAIKGTGEQAEASHFNIVSPEFFSLLGLSPTRGRLFSAHEADTDANVVVINQSAAEQFWPNQDPIGRRLQIADLAYKGGWGDAQQARIDPTKTFSTFEIIGVIPDTRADRVWESDGAVLYLPLQPGQPTRVTTLVKLSASRDRPASLLTDTAAARGLGVDVMDPLDEFRKLQLLPFTITMAIAVCLAALSVLLALIGLYGVMAFTVNQRTREIGIRMALGATTERVVALFVRQGLQLVMMGVAVGAVGGLLIPLTLPKAIVGARPVEPLSLGAVTLLLVAAAMIACWLPARRASRVDPLVTLRAE